VLCCSVSHCSVAVATVVDMQGVAIRSVLSPSFAVLYCSAVLQCCVS